MDSQNNKINIDESSLEDYSEDIVSASDKLQIKELIGIDNDTNISARDNLISVYEESQQLSGNIKTSSSFFATNIVDFAQIMEEIDNDAANSTNSEG